MRYYNQRKTTKENEDKILQALEINPLIFKDLVQATGLSRSTVNIHLGNLVKEGAVKKVYDSGKILNVLQRNADRVKPIRFASIVKYYIAGLASDREVALINERGGSRIPSTLPREEEHKIIVSQMVKRIGVSYLFSLLKMLEEEEDEWFTTAMAMEKPSLSLNLIFTKFLKQRGPVLLSSQDYTFTIPEEAIDGLRHALQQTFPGEMMELNTILEDVEGGKEE